jgi:ABC-type sugar transport system ATPase subunit
MDISIRGLVFERDGRRVLDLPELDFASGSVTALLGSNGAGKTTLLRVLAGLEAPSQGTVALGAARSARDRSLSSALAFQELVFLRGSVRQNLRLGLSLRDVPADEADARIRRAAEETGVAELLDRPARALSAGESQRVNLTRALALEAPVLLLDEPLAGVDRRTRQGLLRDLPHLLRSRGATTVVVTHDREEAFRLADRIAVMVDGRAEQTGATAEVYDAPATADVAELLGYVVLELAGERVAVPPGGFRLSPVGGVELELHVSDIVTLADHRHVVGTIGGVPIEFRIRAEDCVPERGARVTVWVDSARRLDGQRSTVDGRPMTHDP